MDIISQFNLMTTAQWGLAVALIGAIVQAVKKTGKIDSKLLPIVSIVIGAIVGLAVIAVTKQGTYANGAVAGVVAGLTTCGVFDFGSGTVTTVKGEATEKQQLKQQVATLQAQLAKTTTATGTTGVTPTEAGATNASK